jgi:hypothetical protein
MMMMMMMTTQAPAGEIFGGKCGRSFASPEPLSKGVCWSRSPLSAGDASGRWGQTCHQVVKGRLTIQPSESRLAASALKSDVRPCRAAGRARSWALAWVTLLVPAHDMRPRDETRNTAVPAQRWRRKSRNPPFWDRRCCGAGSRSMVSSVMRSPLPAPWARPFHRLLHR